MYRHTTNSIKESSRKQFISRIEKEKFNKYDEIFIEKSDVYTKSEIDEIVYDLDNRKDIYDNSVVTARGTIKTMVEPIELLGNSIHPVETVYITPNLEIGDIDIYTGQNISSITKYRFISYIEVNTGDIIRLYRVYSIVATFYLYNKDKELIATSYDSSSCVIDDPNIKFVRFTTNVAASDISIEKCYINYLKYDSLGEKLYRDTYRISINSVNKNLLENIWEQGSIDGNLGFYTDKRHEHFMYRTRSKNFIPIDKTQTHITYSSPGNKYIAAIRFFDSSKQFIYVERLIGFLLNGQKTIIDIPENACYFKIIIADKSTGNADTVTITPEEISNIEIGCQFEYGIEKTSYEPYISGRKVDVILPCQLERIGNISDRLFKRNDGKWCVEKHIKTRSITPSDYIAVNTGLETDTFERYIIGIDDVRNFGTRHYPIFSSRMRCYYDSEKGIQDNCTNIFTHNSEKQIHVKRLKTDDSLFTDLESFKEFISWSTIKYVVDTPQIIELNEETNLLLETFEGVTSIYVTDSNIQPNSIRVSIPKTMMSTTEVLSKEVNSINNRIKNITSAYDKTKSYYESDTGIIEIVDSNNGVIEDIKLEGVSISNLFCPVNVMTNQSDSYDESTGFYTFNANGTFKNLFSYSHFLKPDTEYTIFSECLENTIVGDSDFSFRVIDSNPDSSFVRNSFMGYTPGETGVKITCIKTPSVLQNIGLRSFLSNSTTSGSIKIRIMIIEGNYTNKPLRYFQGLVSTGENIDTDTSIELSTINIDNLPNNIVFIDNNISDLNGITIEVPKAGRVSSDYIDITDHIGEFTTVVNGINCITVEKVCFYDVNKNYLGFRFNKYRERVFKSDIPDKAIFARVVLYTVDFEKPKGFILDTKNDFNVFGDKKSLLYKKDNMWYPVVLRGIPNVISDSIEKHEDGKYYYHKRCEEFTFNGTESGWYLNGIGNFAEIGINKIDGSNNRAVICDKFALNRDIYIANENPPVGIVCVEGSNEFNNGIRINPNIEKPSNIDEVKTWLTNNNIKVVLKLIDEEVYECTNIDLSLFSENTTFITHSGVAVPKVSFHTNGFIGNTINNLKERVLVLEKTVTERELLHSRLMLTNRYSVDKTKFKVDIRTVSVNDTDIELIKLIYQNILTGNCTREYMEEIIDFYTLIDIIPLEMAGMLINLIENSYFETMTDV